MVTAKDMDMTANEFSQFEEVVANVLSVRQSFFRGFDVSSETLYEECGYKQTDALMVEDYMHAFERNPIANRVVHLYPTECWKVLPSLFESEDANSKTPFEKAFEKVSKGMMEESFYEASETSEGNPIWDVLGKADINSGIFKFSGTLLGFGDGKDLKLPVKRKDGLKLLFMRALDPTMIRVSKLDQNRNSIRFGQPTEYIVTLGTADGLPGLGGTEVKVHWDRILHHADNTLGNPWLGVPRCQPVWNRLHDCEKLYGCAPEMYWKGGFPGISFETHPQLGGDVEINQTEVRASVQNYFNKLQRYMAFTGMTAKSLAPQVVDPTPQMERTLDAICIQVRCPKRIFVGSERGELASTQDEKMWDERLVYRQTTHLTPNMIVPFINRLIKFGVLPKPSKFSVTWPDMDSLTDTEKADIAVKRTMALGQYTQDDIEPSVPFMEFLTLVLKIRKGDAISIVNAAKRLKANKAERITAKPEPKAVGLSSGKSSTATKKPLRKQEGKPSTRVKQQATKGRLKSQQPRNIK